MDTGDQNYSVADHLLDEKRLTGIRGGKRLTAVGREGAITLDGGQVVSGEQGVVSAPLSNLTARGP